MLAITIRLKNSVHAFETKQLTEYLLQDYCYKWRSNYKFKIIKTQSKGPPPILQTRSQVACLGTKASIYIFRMCEI
jgi:hypothetical protein